MKFFRKRGDPRETSPRNFIYDYTFSQIAYFLVVGTVIPKLTDYYNLPLTLSNLIVGIPSALGFIQLLGGYFYNNTEKQHRYMQVTGLLWRVLLPCVLLTVFLPPVLGAVTMCLAFLLMSLFQHLSCPGYNAWLVWSTKGLIKSNYYSLRDMAFMCVFTVVSLLMGMLIQNSEAAGTLKEGFQTYGLIVLVFAALSLPFIIKILPKPEKSGGEKRSILQCLMLPFRDKPYLKILAFHLTWNFFSVLWSNFAGVYQIRVLNLDYFYITVCATVASLVRIICIPIFAKFADKFSWKTATVASLAIMLLHCISWMTITGENAVYVFPITSVLGAVPWAALGIGLFKYQIAYTKEEDRSVYFSVNSTLSGLAAALAGIVSSVLVGILQSVSDTPPFWIIFAIGGAGVALTAFLVMKTPYKEPA